MAIIDPIMSYLKKNHGTSQIPDPPLKSDIIHGWPKFILNSKYCKFFPRKHNSKMTPHVMPKAHITFYLTSFQTCESFHNKLPYFPPINYKSDLDGIFLFPFHLKIEIRGI